jgi:hypothetical protein
MNTRGTISERSSRFAVIVVLAVAMIAFAGCGKSKPAYCSDLTNLKAATQGLSDINSSTSLSDLRTQITTIQSDATTVVNSAKSDFPTETSNVTTSIDTLKSAVDALPDSPSKAEIAAIALDGAAVISAVRSFETATNSACK